VSFIQFFGSVLSPQQRLPRGPTPRRAPQGRAAWAGMCLQGLLGLYRFGAQPGWHPSVALPPLCTSTPPSTAPPSGLCSLPRDLGPSVHEAEAWHQESYMLDNTNFEAKVIDVTERLAGSRHQEPLGMTSHVD
jgi:hypothetical protein